MKGKDQWGSVMCGTRGPLSMGFSIESKYRDILQDIPDSIVGATREQVVQVRVNQSFFRQILLANFDYKYALSGIDIPELLVARSHGQRAQRKE